MDWYYYQWLAHQDASKAGVLHQDISPGNIINFLGTGYLIGWDLAKEIRLESPHRAVQTVGGAFPPCTCSNAPCTGHLANLCLLLLLLILQWSTCLWMIWSPHFGLLDASYALKLSLSIEALSKFIQESFKSSGSRGKENVLLLQGIFSNPSQVLQGLFSNSTTPPSQDYQVPFPSQPSLNLLLKDLVNLFCHHYIKLDNHHLPPRGPCIPYS